jgi:hypothetical protein
MRVIGSPHTWYFLIGQEPISTILLDLTPYAVQKFWPTRDIFEKAVTGGLSLPWFSANPQ